LKEEVNRKPRKSFFVFHRYERLKIGKKKKGIIFAIL